MKKLLLILLLASSLLASDVTTERKIYAVIVHALLPELQKVKVWCSDRSKERIFQAMQGVVCVASQNDADFVLLSENTDINSQAVKFVTSYKLLLEKNLDAVGGFFWQKGRPNILFLRKNLQDHHIVLPQSMQEYIEDEL